METALNHRWRRTLWAHPHGSSQITKAKPVQAQPSLRRVFFAAYNLYRRHWPQEDSGGRMPLIPRKRSIY